MARPFVSVLIDTYNHERFIEKAIVSVLEQDFPAAEREILLVDDGSSDRTPEIVRKFEPHVRVLRKENGGQASAFNAGIPECKGEIIAFLDGDDWWAPGKLKRVTEVLNSEPSVGLLGHGIHEAFADGRIRTSVPEKSERLQLNSLAAARVFRLRKSYLGTSRMILTTKLARRILPIPESSRFRSRRICVHAGGADVRNYHPSGCIDLLRYPRWQLVSFGWRGKTRPAAETAGDGGASRRTE